MKTATMSFLIAVTLSSFGSCYAATWIVDPGGGGDALTINGGIALAGVGDTVLVKPGTYFENVVMGDGVALVSELGWGATTIEPLVDSLPVVECRNLPNKVTIDGFTIREGQADVGAGVYCENVLPNVIACRLTDNRAIDGAGLACISCAGGLVAGNRFHSNCAYQHGGGVFCERSTLSFENNIYTGCEAYYGAACCGAYSSNLTFTGDEFIGNTSLKWGGGISVLYGCTIEVTDCAFDNNSALGSGGCVICWNACRMDVVGCSFTDGYSFHGGGVEASNFSEARVQGSTFDGCSAEYGGAGFNHRGSDMDFIDNDFNHNTSTKWGGAICFRDTSSGTVQDNRFYFNTAIGGGGVKLWDQCDVEMTGNVFWGNSATYGGAIGITLLSTATVRSNTFYANVGTAAGSAVDSYTGSHVDVQKCILASSGGVEAIYCWSGGTATSDCNDFYGNTSDFFGCSAGPNDFFLDPMLCDPENGDFSIDCNSPCAAYPGCGQVGALGVGCGPTRTEPITWGRLKSLYR